MQVCLHPICPCTQVCHRSARALLTQVCPHPICQCAQVELLQEGPRGDLVVGTAEIRVLSLVNRSTTVQWLDMVTFNGSVGARLCVVMRYLSGASADM